MSTTNKVEELLKQIDGKLRMLKFTQEDTPRVLKDHKVKAMERHTNVFEELIEQTHKLKIEVQQNRIEMQQRKYENGVLISRAKFRVSKR